MTHKFEVGDLAVIVRTSPDLTFYMNMRCSIVGPLELNHGLMSHQISPYQLRPNDENCKAVFAPLVSLRPIDGGMELGSWEALRGIYTPRPIHEAETIKKIEALHKLRDEFEQADERAFLQWVKLGDPDRWSDVE